MPRRVSIYNGDNDEIEASVLPVEKIDGVTADRDSHLPLEKVTASMTANDKAENRLAMAVEFDHMYIGCTETKASIGKDIEVQHLKDLLLLHLDLIQQQAEQLVAKDKLIKSLRDENENLRSKLDRIDRRVSLSLSKKSNESTSVEPKTEPVTEEAQPDTHPTKRLGSPTSRVESQITKNQSPSNKNASCSKSVSPSSKPVSPSSKPVSPASKPGSPTSKPGSPTSKPGSPTSKPGSPVSKPVSPASKPGSPVSKPGSPASKPVSPASKPVSPIKPGSPASKPGSPVSKPGSPVSKPGSPVGKPGSPVGKPGSPVGKPGSPVSKSSIHANKSVSPSKPLSPASKSVSPSNKSGSHTSKLASSNNKAGLPSSKSISPQANKSSSPPPCKVVSPASKAGSPTTKSVVLNRKTGPPLCIKDSSPQPKTINLQSDAENLQSNAESTCSQVESPPCSIESSSNKAGSAAKTGKRPSPRWSSPKTPQRERRQRNASQSQSSENDGEVESLKDLPKGISERDRHRLKRRSESESETSPLKRIRTDRDRTSHLKDDGLTDHNLRSRDKSKDRVKGGVKQDDLPASPVEHPLTPTSRAAALEAKKLRQKLQLKEQTRQGQTCGHKRGKTPAGTSVRGEGILNTGVSYYLPYGAIIEDPNPEEEECLQAQVEIPRWGTRILTSLYVMEGTENLEDEIFIKRHAKPEQDEKRRKRWDLQRMREQRHYERLRERYESRQSSSEPTVSGHGSLWPYPESAMYLHVEDTLPVCAFGQPLARIPPQEFAIPWLTGQCLEGVSTRRRKR